RLRLGDAEIRERGISVFWRYLLATARTVAPVQLTARAFVLFYLGQQLADADLRSHSNLGRVLDQLAVLGLLGIDLHGHGFVTNGLDLIDAPSLGQRMTSVFITDKLADVRGRLRACRFGGMFGHCSRAS